MRLPGIGSCRHQCYQYDSPALPIIRKLGWPTIHELIESENLKMAYRSVNNQASSYLMAMIDRPYDSFKRELHNNKTLSGSRLEIDFWIEMLLT